MASRHNKQGVKEPDNTHAQNIPQRAAGWLSGAEPTGHELRKGSGFTLQNLRDESSKETRSLTQWKGAPIKEPSSVFVFSSSESLDKNPVLPFIYASRGTTGMCIHERNGQIYIPHISMDPCSRRCAKRLAQVIGLYSACSYVTTSHLTVNFSSDGCVKVDWEDLFC
uniref:Uncharacterized protein n=1 Tax=Nothobranchius pienaari TaxID=704102 RepID=A0A1A8M847_9TELE